VSPGGYSAPNPFWNDAVHAAYFGLGMAIYARHNRPGLELNAEATRRYLQSFVGESFVSEFAPNAKLKAKFIRPSPAPGPGMLMSALAELGDCETGQAISRRLGAYRRSDLRFGYLPDDRTYYPRANAHVVLGLATLERGCRGQRAGAP
jgi:hypothetical protein